ncbi:MAG: TRAP transporter substrate-binding protein [Deltaproteobacteria bacterium]|nr:TRAP transporter substrate-binding protein [Deltaproteobacteria bacterium]MBW2070010.1 TRAP transporter substrate-binding protein [Deltaproteobacteria bacterium]
MKKIAAVGLTICCVLLWGPTAEAATQALRLAHAVSVTAPYHLGAEQFVKLVEQQTDNRFNIRIFPNKQLGSERSLVEQLQIGSIDLVVTSTGPLGGFVPKMSVVDLPFLFRNTTHVDHVLEGPIGRSLLAELEKAGIKGLAFWENGFRNLTNNRRPILKPADCRGLVIRTMENEVHLDSFRLLGANPTPMAWGEALTALKQGTIDGQENPINIIYSHGLYDFQKYLALTAHFYSPALLLMNLKKYQSLSPEDRQAFLSAAAAAGKMEKAYIRKNEAETLVKLQSLGMQVTRPDRTLFRRAMEPVYRKYEPRFGKTLIQEIQDTP